jgi:hypothetical protein
MKQRSTKRVVRLLTLGSALWCIAVPAGAASWTVLTNILPSGGAGTMQLLTDGTVLVQNAASLGAWYRLTPDSNGSYVNGTWSSIASMGTPRLYFASNILQDGRLFVLGGEYSGNPLVNNWTNTGEIYNPKTNTWSPITPYPAANFGDDPTILIPNGKILAGNISDNTTRIYTIATDSWALGPTKAYNDRSDEETWAKLPNGKVLTYDLFSSVAAGFGYAEVYDPTLNSWAGITPHDGSANGTLPVLSSSALGYELGGILALQDGRMLVLGANQHTALYTPGTNTWAAGPDLLDGSNNAFGADDAPAAIMPSGHVFIIADSGPRLGIFSAPSQFFDFNPANNTVSVLSPAFPGGYDYSAYVTRLLVLPNGQILYNNAGGRQLYIYTPDGAPSPALRPVVNKIVYNGGGVFTVTGKQLNGQSAGSSYGDDVQSDENFPIIRLVNASGTYYCTTFNWSSTGIGGGTASMTVDFTLPASLTTPGNYTMVVSGAGIQGIPVAVNITQAEINQQ